MGLDPVTIGIAGLALGAVSTIQQMEAASDAKSARNQAAEEQRKAQAEQKAMNAQQQAAARRQAIREERVKRARIMQASENTGTSFSSSEAGATGGLSTQLGGNLGFSLGQYNSAARMSDYGQSAANFLSSADNKMTQANMWGGVGSLGMSIFSQAGGFKAFGNKVIWKTF
jgi:hypothetical protein